MESNPLHSPSHRAPVLGRRGVVATSQPLAAQAGLEALNAGGNAADAAVATAAALNVTEPTSTGIGGDAFALYYRAADQSLHALNGSGRSPAGLTLDLVHERGFEHGLPRFHALSVTVPGACAAWCDLVARHGRLSMDRVLGPAIRLAEDGFPVAPITAHFWARGVERQLSSAPGGTSLTIDGRAPRPGEVFYNPGLARTFRLVAEQGAEAFYRGSIAEDIARTLQEAGGLMQLEDLAAHESSWPEPIHTTYRGAQIWQCPPNGQGLVALVALNILQGFDLASLDPVGPERLHLVIEALRLAFEDGRRHIADPDVYQAPLDDLLSAGHARRGRERIESHTGTHAEASQPKRATDTVYLSVVDEDGNACSFINSNYMGFGTGIVPGGWGFTLQNRGMGFELDPSHPNALGPRKRPYHTIIPALATRSDGSLLACFGVMGGFMQPQGHVQVLTGLLDDGLDPQAALDRPRVCLRHGTPDSPVAVEAGIPDRTLTPLEAKGHACERVSGYGRAVFGRGQIILLGDDGVRWAGSDPRADGGAVAQV